MGCRLSTQVLAQVCHGIALHLHHAGIVYRTGGCGGIHAGGVVHKVRRKGAVLDLAVLQVPGQLMDDSPDHLQVSQFFCTCIGFKQEPPCICFSRR